MIQLYTNRIQDAILAELFKANKSIKVAVAWFTNNILFQPLLMKLELGVRVEIITNHDEINLSLEHALDFDAFEEKGGSLIWNCSGHLMHDKICIIDDSVVITGSYNWTNL